MRRARGVERIDPETLLLTTVDPEELHAFGFLSAETEPHAARVFVASEYERPDSNAFALLARRRAPVGILGEATRGHPERSARYCEWLARQGTPYELRAALVTRGRAWGCVVLHRTQAAGDFTRDEARLLARLSRPIAEGLRGAIRADAARGPYGPSAPGLIVLDAHDEVELMTPEAERLLEVLRGAGGATLPMPVLAVAMSARQARSAALHVPTGAGWLTLHGSLSGGATAGRVAVMMQPTAREHAAPRRLEAYGLTARERELATLVARGLTTNEIAESLFLSPWTVQDHLKAIFDKTGTRSRSQLRARVFHEDYLPGMVTRAPLDADGRIVTS